VDAEGPTPEYPDPVPPDGSSVKKRRLHWKDRSESYVGIHEKIMETL
jgi:hypothetical protein